MSLKFSFELRIMHEDWKEHHCKRVLKYEHRTVNIFVDYTYSITLNNKNIYHNFVGYVNTSALKTTLACSHLRAFPFWEEGNKKGSISRKPTLVIFETTLLLFPWDFISFL